LSPKNRRISSAGTFLLFRRSRAKRKKLRIAANFHEWFSCEVAKPRSFFKGGNLQMSVSFAEKINRKKKL